MSNLPFSILIAGMILLAGVLAVEAAEASAAERQASCVSEYFRICGAPSSEQQVRACLASNRPKFTTACLALAREIMK